MSFFGTALASRMLLGLKVSSNSESHYCRALLTLTDFPVMPVEVMSVSLKPTSFFELNPSNDVPRSSQSQSQSTLVSHQTVAPDACGRCSL